MRPTADRVKEAIFNLIEGAWDNRRVLDLFAGSGALGIEALSRGAGEAIFVEADRKCLAVLKANIRICGFSEQARVVQTDALRFLAARRAAAAFTVIFADPPYDRGLARTCFDRVDSGGWLAAHGFMVMEHSFREVLPERGTMLALFGRRRYGDTSITLYTSDAGESQVEEGG